MAMASTGHDLLDGDDADMAIRHQGQASTPLAEAVGEHDGAGLRDAQGRLSDHGIEAVQLAGALPTIHPGAR